MYVSGLGGFKVAICLTACRAQGLEFRVFGFGVSGFRV